MEAGRVSQGYHKSASLPTPRRDVLWQNSVACVPPACVFDLGSGYGQFINSVVARRRIAIDSWPVCSACRRVDMSEAPEKQKKPSS